MRKNGRATLAVFAAGLVLSTAARTYIIAAHTDMNTGFLYHGDEPLCNILYYGIIIAAAVASIFTSRLGENGGEVGTVGAAADIPGGGAVVMGFLVLGAGIFSLYEGIAEIRAISPTTFLMAVDFLFAAVLFVIGFATLFKKRFTAGLGYTYSLIGLYCVGRGLYSFMNRMAIIPVPEYFIESVSLICMSVFFLMLGRYLSGNETRRTSKAVCFWGVGTASLVLSSAFGTIIASFAASETVSSRVMFSTYASESFRQARAGVDAYSLTVTPWVNVLLGVMIAASVVLMFQSPVRSSYED